MNWTGFFFVLGALLMGWLLYRQVRGNPELFSKANFGKSAYTLGLLALGLMAFIGLLVLLLR